MKLSHVLINSVEGSCSRDREMAGTLENFEASLPYLAAIFSRLSLSFFVFILKLAIADGLDPVVLVVYVDIVAAFFLSSLAFFVDRGKRPPLAFPIVLLAFFVSFLQLSPPSSFLSEALFHHEYSN